MIWAHSFFYTICFITARAHNFTDVLSTHFDTLAFSGQILFLARTANRSLQWRRNTKGPRAFPPHNRKKGTSLLD